MKLKALLTVLLVLLTALVAAPPAAADPVPAVTVSPTTGLAEGTTVTVKGTGLPAGVGVRVVECDFLWASSDEDDLADCPGLTTQTSTADGTISARVQVVSTTNRRAFGGDYPVYCSQDVCHMFLVWQDEYGGNVSAESGILEFAAPTTASIDVTPSGNLANGQLVTVTGKVGNAVGHTVQVVEQACFELVQETGCYGRLPAEASKVKKDGTYEITYLASRFLADGTDCTDEDMLGSCRLTLAVLASDGSPDNRYGDSGKGDPGAGLSFGGASASTSRTSGLAGGTAVTVKASRVTPNIAVQLVQCDSYAAGRDAGPDGQCPVLKTVRSTASGTVSAAVTLSDPVYHRYADGSKTPVYCRDDACRFFLVSTDDQGNLRLEAQTDALSFTGSSATVDAYLKSDLPATKWITLRGTAKGAEGRTIKAVEQACYPVESGKPCYGQLPVKWGKVQANGTFAVKYPAQRHLGDKAKTDCTDTGTDATCRVSIVVLDPQGRHDDSFGVRDLGQPGVGVTFEKS